ncbi:SLIT-ROBO Rho GTPase-activating protein 1 [Wickerhamomyces ciferrii]|uniref:Protein BZZ1 n=1 Tax=Wickerhamomyces ciferrii (strain ATCC 14091 / BCRC 22168 / CBS 111 / JCM 3599 / NBRC 0793 / NRRL Y-1031 F-60-10) TaxID=1206466 RepID=K0K8B1_WICCF|nr:SLIT-ROBO Rho GTPase-activating protein 1 [Wickerhamomyces ciferrii]CCH41075.1 SLIT-ROBO Rho GTPase-activating protein 1 [Wickerhamomyces ciferrii]
MAEVSIGNELKDGFKETNNWINNNIHFLTDVEQFYRQRSQIEREYATNLNKLTSEFLKKKANKTTSISVGDEPKITPGSLESASLVTWTELLSQTEIIAKNHHNFGNELTIKVADQIISLQKYLSILQEKISNFHNNSLLKRKDEIFENVNRAKKIYDEKCVIMESTRSKIEKSSSSNDKNQRKINEKTVDMNNAKNDYLLKINIANRIKDKFYYQDLPEILDIYQDLNEFKTKQLNKLLNLASNLEINNNNKDNKNLEHCISIIEENKSHLDIQMFIKHNQTNWSDPPDFYYIPSSIWHDDEHFITSNQELSYLKTILLKANQINDKYEPGLESGRETLNSLQTTRINLKQLSDTKEFEFRKASDSLNSYLLTLSNFILDENIKVSSQVEIETIENNANDKDLSLDGLVIQKKKTNFFGKLRGSKPKETIVSTNDNNNDSQSIRSSKSTKSNHHSSSPFHIPSLRRNRSRNQSSASNTSNSIPSAIAQFPYQADGEDEVSVAANESLVIIEMDDGSGWTKIQNSIGDSGLVPTSYIQINEIPQTSGSGSSGGGKKKGPEVVPKRGAKKISYVQALYDYQSQGDDELTISSGQKIEVLEKDDGSGWTLGEVDGQSGLFPTSYVQEL